MDTYRAILPKLWLIWNGGKCIGAHIFQELYIQGMAEVRQRKKIGLWRQIVVKVEEEYLVRYQRI